MRKSGQYTGCGSIRIAEMPARPSMAAAVEPARPPPTIAMSVYRMGSVFASQRYHCAGNGKQTLSFAARVLRQPSLGIGRRVAHVECLIPPGADRPAAVTGLHPSAP